MTKLFGWILLFPLTVCAQAPEKGPDKIYIGINVSPDISYRTLKNDHGDEQSDRIINTRNKSEVLKFAYTAGLSIGYRFNKRISLETGIYFSNKGYRTVKYNTSGFTWGYNSAGVPENQDDIKNIRFTKGYYYLGVPVKANLTIGNKRLRYIAGIGGMYNKLLFETSGSVAEYENGDRVRKIEVISNDENPLKKEDHTFSVLISAGVDYQINKRSSIRVEPIFSRDITTFVKAPIHEYLYNAGLNIGYSVNL